LKKLGNELYLAGSLSGTNVESSHETSLIQFNKKKRTTDQWTSSMECYWCWKLGHKSSDCKRRAAGEPKLPKPGSQITGAPGGGGGDGGKTQAPCGRCKGKHLTKNCYHDPANASKQPAGWIVKTKDVGTVAIDSDSSDSFVKVHKPDFSIIAVERPSQASNNGLWLIDTGAVPTIVEEAVELVTIKPVTVSTLGGKVKLIKPDFSLVAIDSSAAQPDLAINAQLLLIHNRVNNGHMTFPDNFDLLYDKNVWIFNTGAPCNSSGCMDGAVNIRECKSEVIPANGVIIKQSKVGDIPCSKLDKFGNHVNYTRINSVKFGTHNTFNLFSANNAMQYDWMCRGDCDTGWTIENEAGDIVNFDIRISTGTSCIWCGYFKRHPIVLELGAAAPVKTIAPAAPAAKLIKMPIMKAHDLLRHGDQEKMKATAVALGWTICRGRWCRCVHCAKAKAKRKNIPNDTDHEKAEKPGGRIFTDITSV
jgi:hypothetical protein